MIASPLTAEVLFRLGPVPVTAPVATTWGLMIALAAASAAATSRLRPEPGRLQAALELFVEGVETQIRETLRTEPAPYLPFLGGLFVFIAAANLLALAPGLEPPTAHIETDAALAVVVFAAVHYFGVRALGWRRYLASFAKPAWIMAPLNVASQITRSFSLMVRLFGNMMSGVFVIGILLSLVGLFVPIPFMALDLLTGLIQAYIFTVLAMVFIGGAVDSSQAA